jgi:hypothetical protein
MNLILNIKKMEHFISQMSCDRQSFVDRHQFYILAFDIDLLITKIEKKRFLTILFFF